MANHGHIDRNDRARPWHAIPCKPVETKVDGAIQALKGRPRHAPSVREYPPSPLPPPAIPVSPGFSAVYAFCRASGREVVSVVWRAAVPGIGRWYFPKNIHPLGNSMC